MDDVLTLIRKDLLGFKGYSSSATEAEGKVPEIKLDANESPRLPYGSLGKLCPLNRYATLQPNVLRKRLGMVWGVNPDEILLTAGSNQGIDLLIRLFCSAGKDEILICPPTFPMYEVSARIQNASVLAVPLKENGQVDRDSILKSATSRTKLIFIPAPNAPLGHAIDEDDLLELCKKRLGKSVVVIDEAYIEFSSNQAGMVPYLNKHPNLVVLRTLSKAHALAGERIGAVLAPSFLIPPLSCVAPCFPIAQSSILAAIEALSPPGLEEARRRINELKTERSYLSERLSAYPGILKVYPSEGNFLFIRAKDAETFSSLLQQKKIQIRRMETVVKGGFRVTIGTPKENDILLTALGLLVDRDASF